MDGAGKLKVKGGGVKRLGEGLGEDAGCGGCGKELGEMAGEKCWGRWRGAAG